MPTHRPDAGLQAFPEFNLDDFKSSCLNSDKSPSQPSKNGSEVLLPSSMSMPTIATSKAAPPIKYEMKIYDNDYSF